MPTNYTPLTNGQFATAAIFNAPLTELDTAIEHLGDGSKTMSQPSIVSYTNAQHSHQSAAGGGQLNAAAVASGTFDAARIPTLDASKIGTGVFNNARINWAAPSAIGSTTPAAGTFTGLTVTATQPNLNISGTVGNTRALNYQTSGTNRWVFYTDISAESGSNTGSNFHIGAYADGGTYLNNYVSITRSNGNVNFSGTLSKGGGSFLIDHPLDPLNRNLVHSFVEGPRADLVYRGSVRLSGGEATASIDDASGMTPGTFEALTQHTAAEIWVQNQSGYDAVRGRVVGGMVEIECQNPTSSDLVTWLVIAERRDAFYRHCPLTDDQGRFLVEIAKPALTADDLKALEPIEADVERAMTVLVPELIGRQGYALHAAALNLPLPMREVRPIQRETDRTTGAKGDRQDVTSSE